MVADLEAAAGSRILTKSGVTHISTTSEGVYVSLIVTQERRDSALHPKVLWVHLCSFKHM